jgi:hypothetical protein
MSGIVLQGNISGRRGRRRGGQGATIVHFRSTGARKAASQDGNVNPSGVSGWSNSQICWERVAMKKMCDLPAQKVRSSSVLPTRRRPYRTNISAPFELYKPDNGSSSAFRLMNMTVSLIQIMINIIVICITGYLPYKLHQLISSGKRPGSVSKYKSITVGAAVHASCL